ncbi:MAG: 2,3-dimethylmalate dehydratase small subunit [Firmicutes bacterium ADurb.Bin467]|nr:MAG: 2,3-dimethylmalate dehydratase small subunit [Firmicutes bacterium ADurb.Bin467]
MKLRGFVHKYGDHIDTDVIIPARMLNNPDPKFLAQHCGSSREHAPVAIKAAGISCVIAKNFARIFFRNAINIGLPVLECPEAVDDTESGDELSVDLDTGAILNLRSGKTYTAAPFPPFMQAIIDAGGLVNAIRARREGAQP